MANGFGTDEHAIRSALGAGGAVPERRHGLIDRRSWQTGGHPVRAEANQANAGVWKVRDVAKFLQASESWVRHAAAGGRLPCTKIGGLLRFDPDEIRSLARPDAPARVLPRRR